MKTLRRIPFSWSELGMKIRFFDGRYSDCTVADKGVHSVAVDGIAAIGNGALPA